MDFEKSRLDKYIRRQYGKFIPQSIIEKAVRNRDILVNKSRAATSARVSECDEVFVHENIVKLFAKFERVSKNKTSDREHAKRFESMILYEDDEFVIINKPAGLASQLGSKLITSVDIMAKEFNPELRLVHRLDKDTSGLTILAKSLASSRYMLFLFQSKMVTKKYIAVVSGILTPGSLTIDYPLRKAKEKTVVDFDCGKKAITEIEIAKRTKNGGTLVKAVPVTGRTHQIRVHLAAIDCPILGDVKYGGQRYKSLCLHSSEISFKSMNGKKICVTAALPEHIDVLL
jgi:23S rRNA pseudouridine955/2504/2580 synthase